MPNLYRAFVEPVLDKDSYQAYTLRKIYFSLLSLPAFGIAFLIRDKSYFGEYILALLGVVVIVGLWEMLTHKSMYQLRKDEVAKGRADAQKILEEAGVHTQKGSK